MLLFLVISTGDGILLAMVKYNESSYSLPQEFHTSDFNNLNKDWPGKSEFVKLSFNIC